MRTIDEIIVHCTATPEGRDFTVAQIDACHRQRGFNGIGYHFVVYRDGTIHIGRDVALPGAHCKGHNSRSSGVCYVGGMTADNRQPIDTRTTAQKSALIKLLKGLKAKHPNATIHGHYEYAPKACPCFNVKEYSEL